MQLEEQLIVDEAAEAVPTPKTEEAITSSTEKSKDYDMAQNPITVRINLMPSFSKPVYGTHVLRKPTQKEEEDRERGLALLTKDAGRIEGSEASSMSLDDEPSNVALYDKIVMSISGYGLKAGEKASDEVSPDVVVETDKGSKTLRELIPASHKSTVINGLFPSQYDVDLPNEEEFVFVLGGARTWRIKQQIGGQEKLEDGTLSPPDFIVYYTMREPKESERKLFRKDSVVSNTLRNIKTQEIVERRSTNLGVMVELFDALIENVEGATVGGKEIKTNDKTHLSLIPAAFKKGVVIRLMNFLEAELKK